MVAAHTEYQNRRIIRIFSLRPLGEWLVRTLWFWRLNSSPHQGQLARNLETSCSQLRALSRRERDEVDLRDLDTSTTNRKTVRGLNLLRASVTHDLCGDA
jgi:hypothetical protein